MSSTQSADARFLRRIMLVLIAVTLATGGMAALTTYGSFAKQTGSCQVTGSICVN